MAGGVYNPFGFGVAAAPAAVPRRMPQDIPAAPFGFMVPSKWDRVKQALWESNINAPIRGAYELMNADPYTLYTDTGAAGQQAAADSFDAGTGVMVGSMPAPKPADALTMGIKAYHGSPHSFDKFDMSKIGTGEGAQAYGHGLYFAENEGVAKGYRDTLSDKTFDGALNDAAINIAKGYSPGARGGFGKKIEDALLDAGYTYKDKEWFSPDGTSFNDGRDPVPEIVKDLAAKGSLDRLANDFSPGHMYEVSINADPNAFLDWDKPLSEQPEAVQKAIESTRSKLPPNAYDDLGGDYSLLYDPQNRPGQFLNTLEAIGGRPDTGEQLLKEAGIPGIKYLDAGSRNPITVADIDRAEFDLKQIKTRRSLKPHEVSQAEVDKAQQKLDYVKSQFEQPQSRNYVVFDDKLISIVRKYGIAGASAMFGYNILDGLTDAQAAELKKADGK